MPPSKYLPFILPIVPAGSKYNSRAQINNLILNVLNDLLGYNQMEFVVLISCLR